MKTKLNYFMIGALLIIATCLISCEDATEELAKEISMDIEPIKTETNCETSPVYTPMGTQIPGAESGTCLPNVCYDYSFFVHPFNKVYTGVNFLPPASNPETHILVTDGSYSVEQVEVTDKIYLRKAGNHREEYLKLLIFKNGSALHVLTVNKFEHVWCSHAGPLAEHVRVLDCPYIEGDINQYEFYAFILKNKADLILPNSSTEFFNLNGGQVAIPLAQQNRVSQTGTARWEVVSWSDGLTPVANAGSFTGATSSAYFNVSASTSGSRQLSVTFRDVLDGDTFDHIIYQKNATTSFSPSDYTIYLPSYGSMRFTINSNVPNRDFQLQVNNSGVSVSKLNL